MEKGRGNSGQVSDEQLAIPQAIQQLADLGMTATIIPVSSNGQSPPSHWALSVEVPLSALRPFFLNRQKRWMPDEMVAWITRTNERRIWVSGIGPVNDGKHRLPTLLDEYDMKEVT